MQTNLWLSRQAVGRLNELLAAVAGAPGTSDELRYELDYCRSQVGELMPSVEVLVLAGVLREATDREGLSAATRTDCWSWSSYLAELLTTGPTTIAPIEHLIPETRPVRNGLLVSIAVPDGEGIALRQLVTDSTSAYARAGSRPRRPVRVGVRPRRLVHG
jgi:hypothetical protein